MTAIRETTLIVCLAAVAACAASCSKASGNAAAADRKYLQQCKEGTAVPDDLVAAYNAFVEAGLRGDAGAIEKMVLPYGAVKICREKHAAVTDTSTDLCIWQLQTHFTPDIFSVRQDSQDCYLLRTGTTAIHWVKTSSQGWKVYFYLDKPIE